MCNFFHILFGNSHNFVPSKGIPVFFYAFLTVSESQSFPDVFLGSIEREH